MLPASGHPATRPTDGATRPADLATLGLLQLADSGFPSGAYTLSHGLETLVAEGVVRGANGLAEYVQVCLRSRLARADLPALLAGYDAVGADDIETLLAIDRRLAATKLAAEERAGSARVGRRLLGEVSRLVSSDMLGGYSAAVAAGRAPGNSAVTFGVAGAVFGADRHTVALAAAQSHASALATAAMRLSIVSHAEAQQVVRSAAPVVASAVDRAMGVDWRDLRPSAPQHEIALARHEAAAVRLFAS